MALDTCSCVLHGSQEKKKIDDMCRGLPKRQQTHVVELFEKMVEVRATLATTLATANRAYARLARCRHACMHACALQQTKEGTRRCLAGSRT